MYRFLMICTVPAPGATSVFTSATSASRENGPP